MVSLLVQMKDIREQIKVMEHFANGGEVECKNSVGWGVCDDPLWDWRNFDYRIKEKPKTRPMTFKELIPLVGTPVRIEDGGDVYYETLGLSIDPDGSYYYLARDSYRDFEYFHLHVTRLDGTPFEVEVE